MIIQNVKIIGPNQTLELDRNSKQDFVLETVFLGDHKLNVSTHVRIGNPGQDRGFWTKPLSNVSVIGFAIERPGVPMSLAENKIRLNRFVVPNQWVQMICDNQEPIDVLIVQSVLYDKVYNTNNPAFCRFTINGVAAQND